MNNQISCSAICSDIDLNLIEVYCANNKTTSSRDKIKSTHLRIHIF